jgi:hypothetical protein
MSLILVFNKNSPWAHTELELGVLGVHGKLVKYVVQSSKGKNGKRIIFLHTSCPNSNRPVLGFKEFEGLSQVRAQFLLLYVGIEHKSKLVILHTYMCK